VAAAEDDEPATEIVAATATWARKDRYMRFERGVKIVRGPQTTEADAATAFLTDDEKRLRAIELRGRARITGGEGGAGSLRAMRARDMNLGYAADGRNLETAMLVGNGSIAIAGAPEGSDRRLAAEWIDLGVGPDGSTLTRLNARDKVQMDLPAEADTPARVIRAGSLTGTAAAGGAQPGGITRARFDEGVQFTETTTRAGPPRSARATTMDLVVKPGFSAVEEATFIGAVRFEDGDIVATARDARYDVAHGRLVMPALETTKDDRPKVVMPDATIEARRIELTFEGSKIQARDTVSSVLQPSSRNPAEAGSHGVTAGKARNPAEAGSETRMPAMLDDDQPTYATADELAYDDSSARAVYTGSARLWQGETRVQGDRIELDDRKGDLRAQGSVVTRFLLDNTDQKTSEKKKVETIGRARELVYEEETHRARYTGAAQVAGPDGTITADRIDLYLDEAGDAVERAEASGEGGTVTVEQQGRTAKGDHLTYTAADERYVMIGKVVRIVQETRETLGKTLTFFKSADTIIIDGARETRTQTKSGKKVGEASPRGAEGGPRERSANLREFQSWARGRCGESGSVATWPRSGHTI
jgi:lipopolysaccharide export system protein LptA